MIENGFTLENTLFLLTPLREGRLKHIRKLAEADKISTHAPAGGATVGRGAVRIQLYNFYSRPCGRGDVYPDIDALHIFSSYFYSRPCGRGDAQFRRGNGGQGIFLLTPLREGRPNTRSARPAQAAFLLTPLREGRPEAGRTWRSAVHFYSRPCGRGDPAWRVPPRSRSPFLLTPLREGRRYRRS